MSIMKVSTFNVNSIRARLRIVTDWLHRLYDYFADNYSAKDPILWLGDFNIAPEGIDLYDPVRLSGAVGFHPDEHAALRRFKDWGFIDLFRLHDKAAGRYTFWYCTIRNSVKKNIGWRVDHVWATQKSAEKSVRSWIDLSPRLMERPSDHTPVVVEFDL